MAVASGLLIELTKIPDEVFSTGMMGSGYGVAKHNGEIYSPVSGKILSVFPTKHAITIETNGGKLVLIHMGIDTVELKGEPFELRVNLGDEITAGDKLAVIDVVRLEASKKNSVVIVVFPESAPGKLVGQPRQVHVKELVFKI